MRALLLGTNPKIGVGKGRARHARQMALTLMLCLPSCWAAVFVRLMTAPLLAA
jgi:hypothetical protein